MGPLALGFERALGRIKGTAAMYSDIQAKRLTAERYRRLADQQSDWNERKKFLAYAGIYDELATRREHGASYEEASVPELPKRSE